MQQLLLLFAVINAELDEKNGVLTSDEAMTVASDASWEQKNHKNGTEWSCIYNLDEFSFDICIDRDYETKFTFTKEDFS